LDIPSNDIKHLDVQYRKLQLYSTWAGLPVNASKCAVTAKDYGARKAQDSATLSLRDRYKVGTQAIPVLQPHQAYKYLGVMINLEGTWSEHWDYTLRKLKKTPRIKYTDTT